MASACVVDSLSGLEIIWLVLLLIWEVIGEVGEVEDIELAGEEGGSAVEDRVVTPTPLFAPASLVEEEDVGNAEE